MPSGEDEVVAIVRDVTNRRRVEAERSRLHAESAVDSSSCPPRARTPSKRPTRSDAGSSAYIRDGARQRLVAARVALRLAGERLGRARADVSALIEEADAHLGEAVDELRASVN